MEQFDCWIEMNDGVRLAASVWLPDQRPVPCVLEALPYRKDDITASYGETYELLARAGFAACRVDVRGTGSSGGIATDEYGDLEVSDLTTVITWLAAQDWCTGKVGMFGTSYSGFNSLHLAAAGVPELGAVCAIYSSDDRFTDDVHYTGGVLRAVDVVDYITYMVPMNALPPVPALWGDGWLDEWHRRIELTEPWMLTWLHEQTDSAFWRRGSIRTGPDGQGYERISCPTMLIGGWADGYRNNTFRTVAELQVPWRLLLGPWSHQGGDVARPGPRIDVDAEMIAWFDEHLRGGPAAHPAPIQVFVRHWTAPEPDLDSHAGVWRYEPGWPLERATTRTLVLGEGTSTLPVRPDTGMAAWISCAGGLPWGQPLDQRADDARSITTDWPVADEAIEVLGHCRARLRVQSSAPVAYVSAKLTDVAPDGSSTLVTRGLLNLCYRGSWPADPSGRPGVAPSRLTPGEWYEVEVELEATSWVFEPGHTIRLSLAGTDWPNCWTPPEPLQLVVDRAASSFELAEVSGPGPFTETPRFGSGSTPSAPGDGIEWRYEHDVLARRTRAHTHYGGPYPGTHGAEIVDDYRGVVEVSTTDPGDASATGTTSFEITWPEGRCRTEATVSVRSDATAYLVDIDLVASLDDEILGRRNWSERIVRLAQ